jgi:sulfoxide reductase heme-binding subunit YedZ
VSPAPHLFWITSRAAGIGALLVSSASVAIGILMARRRKSELPLSDLRAIHEGLSLATLALVGLHGVSLLGDGYLHPGLSGIVVPLAGAYRPVWTALGITGGYGLAALGLSYYYRDRIGAVRWRKLHRFTALFWALAVGHSIGAGTDATTPWFLAACAVVAIPAAVLAAGRLARAIGSALGLPRDTPPVHGFASD